MYPSFCLVQRGGRLGYSSHDHGWFQGVSRGQTTAACGQSGSAGQPAVKNETEKILTDELESKKYLQRIRWLCHQVESFPDALNRKLVRYQVIDKDVAILDKINWPDKINFFILIPLFNLDFLLLQTKTIILTPQSIKGLHSETIILKTTLVRV